MRKLLNRKFFSCYFQRGKYIIVSVKNLCLNYEFGKRLLLVKFIARHIAHINLKYCTIVTGIYEELPAQSFIYANWVKVFDNITLSASSASVGDLYRIKEKRCWSVSLLVTTQWAYRWRLELMAPEHDFSAWEGWQGSKDDLAFVLNNTAEFGSPWC